MKNETKYFESLKGKQPSKLKIFWNKHHDKITVITLLFILIILTICLMSCEIESGEMPCMTVQSIDWNMKCNPIIKVPIPGALDYYEVKALLYNDSNESTLMKNVSVIKDTVILNALNIDVSKYQNDKQYCEIYLVHYN